MASRTPALRGWLVVLVLGVVAGLWGVALLGGGGAGKHTPSPMPASESSPESSSGARAQGASVPVRLAGIEVLHRWDRARSAAWAAGDVAGLRALYVDGSPAGAADAALLRRYLRRGLVVAGMRRQLVAVDVLGASSRLLRLRVTDRLVGATARSATDRTARGRALPTSRAVARAVTLRRTAGGPWRMASVRVASGAGPG